MTPKTLSELRQQQRAAVPTTPRFTALSRQIRDVQARADDYAALLELVKTKEG